MEESNYNDLKYTLVVVLINTEVRIHFLCGGVHRIDEGYMYKVLKNTQREEGDVYFAGCFLG